MSTTHERFVNSSLQDDLDALERNVSVEDFVKHVWGYDRADLNWGKWIYAPSTDLKERYLSSLSYDERYTAFFGLVEDALQQAEDSMAVRVSTPCRVGFQVVTSEAAQETGEDMARRMERCVGLAMTDGFTRGTYDAAQVLSIPVTGEFTKRQGISCKAQNAFSWKNIGSADAIEDGPGRTLSMSSITSSLWSKPAPNATPGEVRLLNYATNSLALSGNRRYVTGVLLRDSVVTLWYFDRMGIVRSQAFDLFSEPELFILAVVAMDSCDATAIGYQPLLSSSPREPLSSVVGSQLDMSHALDGVGNATPDDCSFIVTGKALHLQRGLIGRGTVVLPLRSDSGSIQASMSDDLIAKMSWPLAFRTAEDALLRKIRERVGSYWGKYVPDLRCSLTLKGEGLALPRYKMGLMNGLVDPRVFRLLVCGRYERLKDTRTLEEFKTAFLDNVRCHHAVYTKARVLHQDLSVDNLMFVRDKDGDVRGVLNDWDMAEDLDIPAPSIRSIDPIGTTPFMALELLSTNPPSHLYRHDLESFVYILIWSTIQFNLDGTMLQPRHPAVGDWCRIDWNANVRAKLGALMSFSDDQQELLAAVRAPFRPLVNAWIRPLLALLRKAHGARADRAEALALGMTGSSMSGVEWDEETLGSTFTYERFMGAIGEDA